MGNGSNTLWYGKMNSDFIICQKIELAHAHETYKNHKRWIASELYVQRIYKGVGDEGGFGEKNSSKIDDPPHFASLI